MSSSNSPTFKHMSMSCQSLFSIRTAFLDVRSISPDLLCPKSHLHNPSDSLIETNAESDRWVNGPTSVITSLQEMASPCNHGMMYYYSSFVFRTILENQWVPHGSRSAVKPIKHCFLFHLKFILCLSSLCCLQ